MTVYDITDDAVRSYEDLMQEKYHNFYVQTLAVAKDAYNEAQDKLEKAEKFKDEAESHLHKIKTDFEYVKNIYFSEYRDISTNRLTSPYKEDLKEVMRMPR